MPISRLADVSLRIPLADNLSAEISDYLNIMPKIISLNKSSERISFITKLKLSAIHYNILLKICLADSAYQDYLQNDIEINTIFANLLAFFHHPSMALTAQNNQDNYSVFEFYLAAAIMNDGTIAQISRHEIASDLGLNDALACVCLSHIKTVDNATSLEDIILAIELFKSARQKLINIYWGIGNVQAGILSLKLQQVLNSKKNAKITTAADKLYKEALGFLKTALMLESKPYSQSISKMMSPEDGILAYFKLIPQLNTMPANTMQNWVNILITQMIKTEQRHKFFPK
jgi:hypothetical protein